MGARKLFYFRVQRKYMMKTLGFTLFGYFAGVKMAAYDESARLFWSAVVACATMLIAETFFRDEDFTRFWPLCLLVLAAVPMPIVWPVSVGLFLIGMWWSVRLETRLEDAKLLSSALHVGGPVVLASGIMWFMYFYV